MRNESERHEGGGVGEKTAHTTDRQFSSILTDYHGLRYFIPQRLQRRNRQIALIDRNITIAALLLRFAVQSRSGE